jgi:hypothetical protein
MNAQLQQFVKTDDGFRQYCERYNRVAADPETRDEYYRWVNEQMRQWGIVKAAEERGAGTERAKWESLVAGKDAEIAGKDAEIARLRAQLEKKA